MTKYNLIQKFPFKILKMNEENSLFDEGLFPTAALMMQKKKWWKSFKKINNSNH